MEIPLIIFFCVNISIWGTHAQVTPFSCVFPPHFDPLDILQNQRKLWLFHLFDTDSYIKIFFFKFLKKKYSQAVIETRLFKVGPQPTNLQTKHNAFTVLSRFSPAASKAVRSPRPPYVFLRVGEVVIDRKGFMVGVVVSWDPEMRAPTEWVDRVYANSEVSGSITVQQTCGKSRVPLYSVTLFHDDNKKMTILFLWLYIFVHSGDQSRKYASLQSAVQRAWTFLCGHWIPASDSTAARHWTPSMFKEKISLRCLSKNYISFNTPSTRSAHSSQIFPLWKITSRISTASVSSCSPGSSRFTPRTASRTTPFGTLMSRAF